jgi:hypothetical protein
METPNEDLRTHLRAVIEAAPELARDDREHLADVFLDELYKGYELVPRSAQRSRRPDVSAAGQAVARTARHWWLAALAGLALLFALPSLFWATTGGAHVHHPPVFLFFVLFFVAMRVFGPWRRGGRRRFTRTW